MRESRLSRGARVHEALGKFYKGGHLELLLLLGIMLRVVVFAFQGPFNNDNHFEVVQYIFDNHRIPYSNRLSQAYHPPLYYALAAPFLFLGGPKSVQAFSLVLSIGTLVALYLLIKTIPSPGLQIKRYSLLLACLLPQLVMFGNYISNDSLSYFVGSLIFLQVYRYIKKPSIHNHIALAALLGTGLLTKGTFLLFIPVLLFLVAIVNLKKGLSRRNILSSLLIFTLVSLSIGSYKFIENTIILGRPIVMNLDFNPPGIKNFRPTYAGLRSFYDINVLKLVAYPTKSEYTKKSYPLVMYGTFWYQYISESNFRGNLGEFRYIGSMVYLLAVLPTSVFLLGFFRILYSARLLSNYKELDETLFDRIAFEVTSLLLLFTNLLMVVYVGLKYDIWFAFQSRYLFTCFFAIMLMLYSGLDYLRKTPRFVQRCVYFDLMFLYLSFILYFSVEIWLKIR